MPVWKDARARKLVSSFMSNWRVQQKLKRRTGLNCQFRRAATEQPDAGDCLLCCADGVVVWKGSEAKLEISFDSDGEWLCTWNWMYVGKRDSLECPD
ncbi:hypothetical protein QR685DRAFT_594339 [Neurospora intermedia]|uniref:Uncharacterized protein n=1 Tax=Neurospora intermedia TaxID=5142 RepID=A0ABR3DT87_NEUIN